MSDTNGTTFYDRVMVVDDTQVDRFIAERNIKKYSFSKEVILKESAKSALEYLSNCVASPDLLPQLIFLDIRMPEVDGFGFLEAYENLSEDIKSSCIVVMLSTSLNPADHEKAKNNKYVRRFLSKPLNAEKLSEISSDPTSKH